VTEPDEGAFYASDAIQIDIAFSDAPPEYDLNAIAFSYPDESGLATATATPGAFPGGVPIGVC
jgi:hypothetical protein